METLIETLYNDCVPIYKDWLDTTDYQLKILILTSILRENNLGFVGKISELCNFLNIGNSSVNSRKLKNAIIELEEQNYIFLNIEGKTYHISIRDKAYNDKDIVKVRKKWLKAIKDYKDSSISIDWIKIVRVFMYTYFNNNRTIQQSNIAKDIDISTRSVSNALKCLCNIEFDGMTFQKRVNYSKYDGIGYVCKGTDIDYYINFK